MSILTEVLAAIGTFVLGFAATVWWRLIRTGKTRWVTVRSGHTCRVTFQCVHEHIEEATVSEEMARTLSENVAMYGHPCVSCHACPHWCNHALVEIVRLDPLASVQ